MPKFPDQYILIGDENLKNATVVSTDPTSGIRSKKTGPVIASASNEGDMTAFLSGTPSTNAKYIFRGQRQGTTNDGTFVWKLSTEQDESYKGEQTPGVIHSVSTVSPTPTNNFFPKSLFTVYSKKLNKEFCYYTKNTNILNIAHRDYTRRGEGDWTQTTFDFNSIGRTYKPINRAIDGAILKDGSIVVALISEKDVDVYISTDGLIFALHAENLFAEHFIFPFQLSNIQVNVSGNYIDISLVSSENYFGSKIRSFISADNGSSWSIRSTDDQDIITPGKWSFPALDESQDEIWSIGSIDDEGSFLMLNVSTEGKLEGYYATGSSGWSYVSGFTKSSLLMTKPKIVNTSSYIYIFFQRLTIRSTEAVGDHDKNTFENLELCISYFDKENFVLGSSYAKAIATHEGITSFEGLNYMVFRDLSIVENGSGGLNFLTNLIELCGDQKRTFPFFRMGGWDTHPLRDYNRFNFRDNIIGQPPIERFLGSTKHHIPYDKPYVIQFESFAGTLGGGFACNILTTPWVMERDISTAGTVFDWNAERMKLTDAVQGTETGLIYKYTQRQCFVPSSIGVTTAASNGAITNFGIVDDFGNPAYQASEKTPLVNWAFIPVEEEGTSTGITVNRYGHGSCYRFICKTSAGTTTNGVDSMTVAGLSTYLGIDMVHSSLTSVATTRVLNLEVRIGKANACLYDVNGGSSVAVLTPDVATYGTTPFSDNFWEFRLAIQPYNNATVGITVDYNGYIDPKVILLCRRLDREDWSYTSYLDSSNFSTDHPASTIVLNQMCYWGHKEKQGSGVESEWKSVAFHQGNDFGTLASIALDSIPTKGVTQAEFARGRYLSSFPTMIDDTLSISWGGSGMSVGDTFHMDVDHTYAPTNPVRFESPRIKFQSVDNPSQPTVSIIYQAPDNKSFNHDSVAVFNSVGEKVEISYSNDSSSFAGATHTLNLSTDIKGRIVGVDNNIITLELSSNNYSYVYQRQFASSNKRNWYLKTTALQSGSGTTLYNGPVYKIDKSISIGSNQIQMHIDTNNVSSFFPISAGTCQIPTYAVGVTMTVFADRGITNFSRDSGKFMKVTTTRFEYGAQTSAQIGTIIAGLTQPFTVPLDWAYSDTETPNNETFTTRSGTNWRYEKGPAARKISLNLQGDINERFRSQFRSISRGLSKYGKNPLVLVTLPEPFVNQGDVYDNVILSRYDTATDFKNEGWHYDPDLAIWTPVGSMSMIFSEII